MQNGLQERTFEITYQAGTGNGIYKFDKRAFDFIVALTAIVAPDNFCNRLSGGFGTSYLWTGSDREERKRVQDVEIPKHI